MNAPELIYSNFMLINSYVIYCSAHFCVHARARAAGLTFFTDACDERNAFHFFFSESINQSSDQESLCSTDVDTCIYESSVSWKFRQFARLCDILLQSIKLFHLISPRFYFRICQIYDKMQPIYILRNLDCIQGCRFTLLISRHLTGIPN